MRITARMFACIGALMAVCLMAPVSFASPLDTSVAYGLHVVSVDVDVGWHKADATIQQETKSLHQASNSGGDGRCLSGVSYLINNAGITERAFTNLEVAQARGPPLRI